MYIVYLCFGENKTKILSEIIYSLLSFNAVCKAENKKAYSIVIYSEEIIEFPRNLDQLQIKVEYLNMAVLAYWLDRCNFYAYVVKPRVIEAFLVKFRANCIFVDSDTFFLNDPIQLFRQVESGKIIMHLKEFEISNRKSIASFFLRNTFHRISGEEFSIGNFEVWNSGVIGIGLRNIEHVRDAISLIEQISNKPDWPSNLHTIEQIALSYYFRRKQIRPAEKHIIHYWFFKPFRYILACHFDYFHNNDFETADAIKKLNNAKGLSPTFNNQDLLNGIKEMVKYYVPSPVLENLLKSLPLSSFIGQLLRK